MPHNFHYYTKCNFIRIANYNKMLYKYSRSGAVFFAFLSRCRGFQTCFDVLVSRISSFLAISGCLEPNACIAVAMASSLRSVLVGMAGGGSGNEYSYGKSGVGCHEQNSLSSLLDTTLSTLLHPPDAVVLISVDFNRICKHFLLFNKDFVMFWTIFSRKAAMFQRTLNCAD